MSTQRIILGDCLDVFANERNVPAFVSDPPANIGFMGRSWDKAHPAEDYVPILPPRDKAHLRELQREHAFVKYWATRYSMAYDIADKHAVNIVWTLPRTSYQTATALRAAGWTIKDTLVHLFGSGWAKTGNALAPGQEGWILATKGSPDLGIDACRVPRGDDKLVRPSVRRSNGVTTGDGMGAGRQDEPGGSLPKNAALSHCEECMRVGSKRVRSGITVNRNVGGKNMPGQVYGNMKYPSDDAGYARADGTESVPAFNCLAGCVCGARTPWPDDRPLPRCPCGETWRWLCPVAEINGQSGTLKSGYSAGFVGDVSQVITVGRKRAMINPEAVYADQGGAARFFNTFKYLSKCSPSERHAGCENLFWKADKKDPFGFVQVTGDEWEALPVIYEEGKKAPPGIDKWKKAIQRAQGNVHPTVKSYRLMHWLHSLTGAKRILDLTAGSGTGMYTAYLDGIDWFGAEICPQAIVIAEARLAFWRGLSFDARRAFMDEDVAPEPQRRDERELLLFAGLV